MVWLPDDKENLVVDARILLGTRIPIRVATVRKGEKNFRKHVEYYEVTYNQKLRRVVDKVSEDES